jgi:hypothetical protein
MAEVNFNQAYSGSGNNSQLVKLTFTTASISTVMDTNGVRAFELSGSSVVSPATTINDFTQLDNSGNIYFFVTALQ